MSDIQVGGVPIPNGGSGVRQLQLNPERAPALIAKWQKLLGKELEKISIEYTADGVTVDLFPLEGNPSYKTDKDGDAVSISVAAFKAAKQEAAKPSAQEAITAFKNKFELRLNLPFPVNGDLGAGDDAAFQAFLQGLPFHQRRCMLMSNKQFKTAYPNGYAQAGA